MRMVRGGVDGIIAQGGEYGNEAGKQNVKGET